MLDATILKNPNFNHSFFKLPERYVDHLGSGSVSSDVSIPPLTTPNETVPTVSENSWPIISYRNPNQVFMFLDENSEIEPFLVDALPVLATHFIEPIEIIFELLSYPDEDASDELVGWIQCEGDIETWLDKLEVFEDQWLIEQLDRVGHKFNFNIEFR